MRRPAAAAIIAACSLGIIACAPVLDRGWMDAGTRDLSFAALREGPAPYMGKLYILGGIIVQTRLRQEGSFIEALHMPVDRSGSFEDSGRSEGRFLAMLPAEQGVLDPAVYRKGRRVTIAAEFTGTSTGRIDEMTYTYPVFRIREVYLWRKERRHDPSVPHYDRWLSPYPYYYRHPWWVHPERHAPMPVRPPEPKQRLKKDPPP